MHIKGYPSLAEIEFFYYQILKIFSKELIEIHSIFEVIAAQLL